MTTKMNATTDNMQELNCEEIENVAGGFFQELINAAKPKVYLTYSMENVLVSGVSGD